MTRHECPGIRTEPLGSYLAGLGLFRVIGEQADSAATAWWTDSGLVIDTTVADLAEWLVTEFEPTPVLSPWNSGSGFGLKDKESKRRIEDLLASPSPRLASFRQAIPVAREVVQKARSLGWIKPDTNGGEKVVDKARIVQAFRNWCPDSSLGWIDAAVVLAESQPYFPPLLGTGGNDGRLDFSTNFHQRLLDVMADGPRNRERSSNWAEDLLTGVENERLDNGSVGQFDPAAVGGQSSSPFGQAESLVNPWAYVLLTEGALLFASGTARRHQHAAGRAAMPFTVRFSPDGSDSGAAGEASRGEVWVPVWRRPCVLAEICQLFGEARANWKGKPAERAVDFYAATRTLGVARGIDQFVRYGLQQRNGLAFVAVPVARVTVKNKSEVRLAARVEDWVSWLRGPDASSATGVALRHFEAAHLAYAQEGGPRALAGMLAELTDLEQTVGRSGRLKDRLAVRRPPPAWDFLVEFRKAECAELRVAVGIASCLARGSGKPGRSMRQILLPVDPEDPRQRSARWRHSPVVPGLGLRPLRQVLSDVLTWRSRVVDEDDRRGLRGISTFPRGLAVPTYDLHAFALRALDENELYLWLRACLALDWSRVADRDWTWHGPVGQVAPVPTLGLLQPLACGLTPVGAGPDTLALGLQPDWANRLAAGQAGSVHRDAATRLLQAGWFAVPYQSAYSADAEVTGIDIAAALVPRCGDPEQMLHCLATRIREESDDNLDATHSTEDSAPLTPEMVKELS